jgi:hypothetical protein
LAVAPPLLYLKRGSEKPAYYRIEPLPGVLQWNGIDHAREVFIEDVRGRKSEFTLNRNRFALVKAPTAVTDFYDPEEIKRVCYPGVERLLRDTLGGDHVVIFDHNVRNAGGTDLSARSPAVPQTRFRWGWLDLRFDCNMATISGRFGEGSELGVEAKVGKLSDQALVFDVLVDVVIADHVSDEDSVENSTLERRAELGPIFDILVLPGTVARMGPESRRLMGDAVHVKSVEADLSRHGFYSVYACPIRHWNGGAVPFTTNSPTMRSLYIRGL